jgi:hypothetical protein
MQSRASLVVWPQRKNLDLRALVRHRSVLPGMSFVEPNENNAHSSFYRVFGAGAVKSAHGGLARKPHTARSSSAVRLDYGAKAAARSSPHAHRSTAVSRDFQASASSWQQAADHDNEVYSGSSAAAWLWSIYDGLQPLNACCSYRSLRQTTPANDCSKMSGCGISKIV